MAAQRRRPACRDCADHPTLDTAKMPGMIAQIGLAMTAQDIGDLDGRPIATGVGVGHDPRQRAFSARRNDL